MELNTHTHTHIHTPTHTHIYIYIYIYTPLENSIHLYTEKNKRHKIKQNITDKSLFYYVNLSFILRTTFFIFQTF